MHQIAYFEKRARRFLWTSKYGHLGSGIPYAIGAQLALGNNHPVCLITGDGGMGFHIMEFETAVRHRLPIVIVINDDRALGAEMEAHMQHIGHTIEVSFSPVRYDGIATAMGGYGEYVDTVAGIAPAIGRALAQKRPAIVQVAVDPESALNYAVPLRDELSSWLFEDPAQAMSTN
jgi:thiamine pyrophosphate-dependent acetolactate synthase large subunit-like protein